MFYQDCKLAQTTRENANCDFYSFYLIVLLQCGQKANSKTIDQFLSGRLECYSGVPAGQRAGEVNGYFYLNNRRLLIKTVSDMCSYMLSSQTSLMSAYMTKVWQKTEKIIMEGGNFTCSDLRQIPWLTDASCWCHGEHQLQPPSSVSIDRKISYSLFELNSNTFPFHFNAFQIPATTT